jgi:hypothetical protein
MKDGRIHRTRSRLRTGASVPMESFFHTVKVERIRRRRWATHEEVRRELSAYIEG